VPAPQPQEVPTALRQDLSSPDFLGSPGRCVLLWGCKSKQIRPQPHKIDKKREGETKSNLTYRVGATHLWARTAHHGPSIYCCMEDGETAQGRDNKKDSRPPPSPSRSRDGDGGSPNRAGDVLGWRRRISPPSQTMAASRLAPGGGSNSA
jgi:hypothetical protein